MKKELTQLLLDIILAKEMLDDALHTGGQQRTIAISKARKQMQKIIDKLNDLQK